MNKKSFRKSVYLPLVCATAFVAVVIQTILYLFYYDADHLLYKFGAPTYLHLIPFFMALAVAIVVLIKLPRTKIKLTPIGRGDEQIPASAITKIGALIMIFGALLSGVLLFCGNLAGDHAVELLGYQNDTLRNLALAAKMTRFSAYIGVIAAIYPALLLISGKVNPFLVMLSTVWLATLDLTYYFDSSTVMNDPYRMITILGLSTAMLWLMLDIRQSIGRATMRMLLGFGALLAPIIAAASLPELIVTAVGVRDFTSRTFISAALLGILIMLIGRLCELVALPESEDAAERELSIKEELSLMRDAPNTDLYAFPDDDDEDEGSDDSDTLSDGEIEPEIIDIADISALSDGNSSDGERDQR